MRSTIRARRLERQRNIGARPSYAPSRVAPRRTPQLRAQLAPTARSRITEARDERERLGRGLGAVWVTPCTSWRRRSGRVDSRSLRSGRLPSHSTAHPCPTANVRDRRWISRSSCSSWSRLRSWTLGYSRIASVADLHGEADLVKAILWFRVVVLVLRCLVHQRHGQQRTLTERTRLAPAAERAPPSTRSRVLPATRVSSSGALGSRGICRPVTPWSLRDAVVRGSPDVGT